MRSPPLSKKSSPKSFIVLLILSLLATLPFLASRILFNLYFQQGNTLSSQNRREEAIAAYEQSLQFDPNHADTYFNLAQLLSKQKKFSEAFVAYQKAVVLDPNLAIRANYKNIYHNLGKALSHEGKITEAIAAYQQAITIDPNDGQLYNDLGLALTGQKKYDEAIAAYQRAIKLEPSYAQAYHNIGLVLQAGQNYRSATIAYQKAIQLDPDYIEAYNSLGKTLVKQGRLEEAIAFYTQAIGIDPNYADTYNNLGEALHRQGQIDKAIALYRETLKLDSDNATAYKNLCYAFEGQKQFEQAIPYCQQAFKLEPDLKEVKFRLQEMQRVVALEENPQLFTVPERIPTSQTEPDVSLKRSVVRIITKSNSSWGIGTGWVIKRERDTAWIVTNRHVLTQQKQQPASQIEVEFYSEPSPGQFRHRRSAKIVRMTSASDWLDIALLKITDVPKDIQPLPISSKSVLINSSIRVIGHPQTSSEWSVLKGEVTDKTSQQLKLSAILASGSSGSPVLNEQNQVIGVAVAVKLFCDARSATPPAYRDPQLESTGISLPLSCGVAFPIEAVKRILDSE